MAQRPFDRDQSFSWEKEFDSELRFRSDEDKRLDEQSQFDDRLSPEHHDTEPHDTRHSDTRLSDTRLSDTRHREPEHRVAEHRVAEHRDSEHRDSARLDNEWRDAAQHDFDQRIRYTEAHEDESYYIGSRESESEPRPILIWPEDNTPTAQIASTKRSRARSASKMGRATRATYLALLLVLAFGAVWVLERDIEGPATTADTQTSPQPSASARTEPPPLKGEAAVVPEGDDRVASRDLGDSPSAELPPSAPAKPEDLTPVVPTPVPEDQPSTTARPSPPPTAVPRVAGSSDPAPASRTADADRQTRPAPPERRLNIEPPARPPYRSIPEPDPPRNAVAETPGAALPRAAVDEPALRPQTTPPAPVATPPAAAARPPAASPTPAAAAPAAADVESGAIRDVIGRYRRAFNSLDAQAAHQVWPTVNPENLDRAFERLQEQSLSFDRCTIAVKGVLAEANCSGTTRFVPRVGSRSAQTQRRQWNFSLRKAFEGAWLIQHVEAR